MPRLVGLPTSLARCLLSWRNSATMSFSSSHTTVVSSESGRSFRPVCRLKVPTPQGHVDTLIEEDVISVGEGELPGAGVDDSERGFLRPTWAVSRSRDSIIPIISTGFHSSVAQQ